MMIEGIAVTYISSTVTFIVFFCQSCSSVCSPSTVSLYISRSLVALSKELDTFELTSASSSSDSK